MHHKCNKACASTHRCVVSLCSQSQHSSAGKYYVRTSIAARVVFSVLLFPHYLFSPFFCFSPPYSSSGNSDPGSHSRLPSLLPTRARAFLFVARILQLFLPSSTCVALSFVTRSCHQLTLKKSGTGPPDARICCITFSAGVLPRGVVL